MKFSSDALREVACVQEEQYIANNFWIPGHLDIKECIFSPMLCFSMCEGISLKAVRTSCPCQFSGQNKAWQDVTNTLFLSKPSLLA